LLLFYSNKIAAYLTALTGTIFRNYSTNLHYVTNIQYNDKKKPSSFCFSMEGLGYPVL